MPRINPVGLCLILAPFAFLLAGSWWSATLSILCILTGCATLQMPGADHGETIDNPGDQGAVSARSETPQA